MNPAVSAFSGRQPRGMRVWARSCSVCLLVMGMFAGLLLPASPAAAQDGSVEVNSEQYYTKPVQWMTDNIVTDTTPACFGPDIPATRGETALYMWRIQGQPDAPLHPFSDVTDDEQQPAVSWLYGAEITTGTTPTTFAPDEQLTRAQVAALLHRLAGKPPASGHPFIDVSAGWQQQPVAWMVANRITTGTSPTTFAPDEPVTRGQLATFLYRYQGSPAVTVNPVPACNRFTAVDVGARHSCGLRADQTIACWGSNDHSLATPPDGLFKSIETGTSRSCGIRIDNTVSCWGSRNYGILDAPPGQFSAISTGDHYSCGIFDDATIACWGAISEARPGYNEGKFSAISTGVYHICALRTDNTVTCWEQGKDGRADGPEGEFDAISAGHGFSCGIRTNASITCWGGNTHGPTNAPTGSFTDISAGHSHTCALRADTTIQCWGGNIHGQANAPTGSFTDISAGEAHSCALRTDATITCWGRDWTDQHETPDGEFTAIATGDEHACALSVNATISCWGYDINGKTYPPTGAYIDVIAGAEHTCGLRFDETVECWGENQYGQKDPPDGQFTAITAGVDFSCGTRTDATIECWGNYRGSQTDAPSGRFTAISAGHRHSCGIRTNGTVECWGVNWNRQTNAPPGQFTAISAANDHSCGIRTDATIECWGHNGYGQTNVPSGKFTAISGGDKHSCGINTNRTIICWGRYHNAESGLFSGASAGTRLSCGLHTDATISCWYGISTIPAPLGVESLVGSTQANPAMCRPFGVRHHTAGFPLPSGRVGSTGTARVAVLFVDFPDAEASHSTVAEAQLGLPYAEAYLEASSHGMLDIEFVPLHRWLRAEHDYEYYLDDQSLPINGVGPPIDATAVRLADPEFDFTGIDALMVVLPSSHFGGGVATGAIETDESNVIRRTRINVIRISKYPRDLHRWGSVAAHELIHNLGLLDMYPYAGEDVVDNAALAPVGKTWVTSTFGLMGLGVDFPADPEDPRLVRTWLQPNGAQFTEYTRHLEADEMLAWSRWQLGWLDSEQISCVTEAGSVIDLNPVAEPGDGIAMVAIPLSGTEVIVIENRRRVGYDLAREQHYPDRVVEPFPTLLADGVLVYTVDTSRPGGRLPIAIAGNNDSLQVDRYPILTDGESVTIRGYTITVQSSTESTHTVSITKTI